MGEYIKYKNSEIKIGTVENLYYVRFDKFKQAFEAKELSHVDGNFAPWQYLDTQYGFRFRFPFPDEDKLPFGEILGDYNRGIPIRIDQAILPDEGLDPGHYEMKIMQQKPIIRRSDGMECLALVWASPHGELSRIEDDAEIRKVVGEVIRHHVVKNPDKDQKAFYLQVVSRILEGYKFSEQQIQKIVFPQKNALRPKKTGRRL